MYRFLSMVDYSSKVDRSINFIVKERSTFEDLPGGGSDGKDGAPFHYSDVLYIIIMTLSE